MYPAVRALPKHRAATIRLARYALLATFTRWLICRTAGIFIASQSGCRSTRRLSISSPPAATAASAFLSRTTWCAWPLNVCAGAKNVTAGMSPKRAWKSCVTLRLGRGRIWQAGFFDHLLRSDESAEQKWEYVRQNPVRAGLCDRPENYAWSGTPEEILRRIGTGL